MKTTIKGLIKQHLIRVCKEKTAIMRERLEVKPTKQFTKKRAEEAQQQIRTTLDQKHVDSIMNALSILFDAPELSRQVFQLELLGVLVLEKCASGHPYGTNVPGLIVKNPGGSGNRLFYSDGNMDVGYQFTTDDNPRPATDAEVEQCIENLTEKQWAVVLHQSSALFAPLVAEAMSTEIEVLDIGNGEAKKDGEEIETNGRRITMAETKE